MVAGLRSSDSICFGWVHPFKIPRKPRIGLRRVQDFFGWVHPFKIPRKLQRSPSSKIFWVSPSFKIPKNHGKIQVSSTFWMDPPLKNHRKPQKIQILKPVHRGKTTKNPNFKTCSMCLAKKFPDGKPSHLPLVSPHIYLQISHFPEVAILDMDI